MAAPVPKLTPQEYLELERRAEFKSEYWHGEVFAMAGASIAHNVIRSNVEFQARLRSQNRDCLVLSSDLKVGVHRGRHGFAYPDVVMLCGRPEFVDAHQDVITNPVVLFEVLSPSTEASDRGLKFVEYRKLPALRHYVLVSQEEVCVEHFSRQEGDTWLLQPLRAGDTLRLTGLGLEVPIDLFYERVDFPPATSEDAPA
jgi:Uma2 family endonuclease